MKRHAQLGAEWFEQLQIMKTAWRNNLEDLTVQNSAEVEEIVENNVREYEDFLAADEEQGEWDNAEGDAWQFTFCSDILMTEMSTVGLFLPFVLPVYLVYSIYILIVQPVCHDDDMILLI